MKIALLALLLLLTISATVQAQDYNFTTNNGTITITGYIGPGGNVTIPDTINGLAVTSIGDYAFEYRYSLTNVTIPDSVTSIGAYVFNGSTNLTSVTIPNSVTNIGIAAFYGCYGLTVVTIPTGLTTIAFAAFQYCTDLKNITIPDSVTNIEGAAFNDCTNLTGIYFQGNAPSVNVHGIGVFSNDDNAIVYYLSGTTGWGFFLAVGPRVLWNPQVQTSNGNFGFQTNQFGFNVTGTTNLVIVVQACTDPANPVWSPLRSNTLPLNGGSFYFRDSQWTNYPSRFYRLHWPE